MSREILSAQFGYRWGHLGLNCPFSMSMLRQIGHKAYIFDNVALFTELYFRMRRDIVLIVVSYLAIFPFGAGSAGV